MITHEILQETVMTMLSIGLDLRQRLINNSPKVILKRSHYKQCKVHEIEEESSVQKVNAWFAKGGG
jgi:hypothetical protein